MTSEQFTSGTGQLENVEIEYENDLIVVDGVGIELRDSDGERMGIDHSSGVDGYVAFRERASSTTVKVDGDEATLCFVETGTERS